MKKNNLLGGAFILSIGGIMAKLFSAIYRIFLTRILGGVGIGVYQLIFPFYSLCVVLATAGIPLAISKIIAKNKGNEKKVLAKSFMLTSIISLVLVFLLTIFSNGLASLQGNKSISICYIILAPTIIFISIASVLRGYFQGIHKYMPSTISNILEQFIKMVFGLILSVVLIKISVLTAIIGAMVSIVISEVLSLIVLIIFFKKEKLNCNQSKEVELKEIVKDVIPITLTNLILPISAFLDSVLVVNLLSVNFSNDFAVFLYGLESGAVSTIIGLPTIFSFAIASVILPNLTASKNILNNSNKLSMAIKIVLIIVVPCVLVFILIPNNLLNVLYSNNLNGFSVNGIDLSGSLMIWSSVGVVFLAMSQVYSTSLQAIDKRFVTIRNLIIAVVLKFIIEILYLPSRGLNIYSLAIANTVCYITTMILNHVEIKRSFQLNLSTDFIYKLIAANCLMILTLLITIRFNNSWQMVIISVLLSMIVYLFSLYKLKILDKKSVAMLKYRI